MGRTEYCIKKRFILYSTALPAEMQFTGFCEYEKLSNLTVSSEYVYNTFSSYLTSSSFLDVKSSKFYNVKTLLDQVDIKFDLDRKELRDLVSIIKPYLIAVKKYICGIGFDYNLLPKEIKFSSLKKNVLENSYVYDSIKAAPVKEIEYFSDCGYFLEIIVNLIRRIKVKNSLNNLNSENYERIIRLL